MLKMNYARYIVWHVFLLHVTKTLRNWGASQLCSAAVAGKCVVLLERYLPR